MNKWLPRCLVAAALATGISAPVSAGVILLNNSFDLDGLVNVRLASPGSELVWDGDSGGVSAPAGFTSWTDYLVLSAQTSLESATGSATASAEGLSLGAAYLDSSAFLISGLTQLTLTTTDVGEPDIYTTVPAGGALISHFQATFQVVDSPITAFLDAAAFLDGDSQSDIRLFGVPEFGGHSVGGSVSYQQQAVLAPGEYTFDMRAQVFPFLFQLPAADYFQRTSVSSFVGSLRFVAIPEPPTYWLIIVGLAAMSAVLGVGSRSGSKSRRSGNRNRLS